MTSGYERIANYTVVNRIGSGRFGEVFLVRHKHTGQLFCWKVVAYKGLSDKEKQQLVMEVNVIRELNHPNIVRYIDRMIDKRRQLLYILMEYCDAGDLGENMRQFYKHYKLVNEQVIFDIALQLIFALAYCHNCKSGTKTGKVLHRDLKPQNILLSTKHNKDGNKSYVCKIGDFGLCRQIGMSSFANSCVGTPYYWCPELLLSNTKSYDDKMDIWALGCVLYELSSGKTPFHYTTTLPELTQEMKQGVPLPLEFRSNKLNSLLSFLLQKDPNKRASALQLLGYSFWTEPPIDLFITTLSKSDYENFMKHKASQENKIQEEGDSKLTKDWYTLLVKAAREGRKNHDKESRLKNDKSIKSLVNLSNFHDVYGTQDQESRPKFTTKPYSFKNNINILEYVKKFQDSLEQTKTDPECSKLKNTMSTPIKRNQTTNTQEISSIETRISKIESDFSNDSTDTKIPKYETYRINENNRNPNELIFKINRLL
uniref:non-specific serine/threonine protein kinase n=1 Tax=Theileria annulata TaxID=5874 RepID=A0A3B0MPB8_THEAN